jgi:predicted DNA-binding transcriptional regulator AlpA
VTSEQQVRLPARLVWTRFGVTSRTLDRWIGDDDLGFPRPMLINKRRYFLLGEIEAWERQQARSRSTRSTLVAT